MNAVEWTDAEREAAAGALRKSRLTWGTHSDRWGDTPWQRDFWGEAADTVLEALAPFVAAREAQAAAKAWREGYDEGVQRGIGLERTGHLLTRRHELGPVPANPYRIERGESS